jgi:hypothetical protein
MLKIQVFWDVMSYWDYTAECGCSHEPQNSGFQPFMITQFITTLQTCLLVPINLDVIMQLPPLSCHYRQLIHALPFINWGQYFNALRNDSSFNHFIYSMLPESIHILLKVHSDACMLCEVILCFYYWYISSSCNQTGILTEN